MEDKIITVEELRQRLSANEPIFILDVRPIEQRNEWRIAGSAHVNAYAQLNEGDDSALDMVEIPKQATVVTVCAAGRTSLLASRLLRRKGIEAFSLEGGMKAWNYSWNTAEVSLGTTKIIQVRRPAKGVLSYVAGSLAEAVVIDAALDPEVYVRIAEDNGWTIRYVMDSHVHADFVSRTRELARVTGARHLMIDEAKVDFEFAPVTAGGSIHFGDTQLTFLHTPGHTWESTTFQIEDKAVFTGDTLFTDGVGRPDLKAELPEVHQ
ncbi:MAG TPA: rhodanese-like domain-containing protein, partial [Chryseosolibacter sp.]|nr:rhodanese-like domain-containing protein [Chryseosolibacter sp.]